MGYRRESDPSPLRTGITHAGLSLAVFGGLSLALGTGIHVVGDPGAAGPRQTLALFEPAPATVAPVRAASLVAEPAAQLAIDLPEEGEVIPGDELTVAYSDLEGEGLRIDITGGQGGPIAPAEGLRINGRFLGPGQSLNDPDLPSGGDAAQTLRIASVAAEGSRASGRSKAPADIYARPFSNPDGKPAVALVIGGLGLNPAQTRSAIDELPPEITLSFAPDAKRLDYWMQEARKAGHEVLIEVPMEAHDYGRVRMHPDTLLAGDGAVGNLGRLDQTLRRTTGYFGIINYQGAKFAADDKATGPVIEALAARGLAFIDDGSIQRSGLASLAADHGLRFARARGPIDTRQTSTDISGELMELEALAREQGAAFGTGYAFPITIETTRVWVSDLKEKGIVLAPASAVTSRPTTTIKAGRTVRTGSLGTDAVNTGG